MHLTVPRRHSVRTLGLLLIYYGAAGALGMLVVAAIAATFALADIAVTPAKFAIAFGVALPAGLALMLAAWHWYFRPRIRFDREVAFSDFEAIKRHYGG